MGSVGTCMLKEVTLYGVNKDFPFTRRYFNGVNKDLHVKKKLLYMGSISTCL